MRAVLCSLLTLILLPACAQKPTPERVDAPPFYAPSTFILASRETPIDPLQVLSGPEADLYTLRAEKVAYGPVPLGGVTTFTTYTYDAQRISTFTGYGYRYRWVVESGISAPTAP